MCGPPDARTSGMANITLGYLWNAPLRGHDALASQVGHDARGPSSARPHVRAPAVRAFPDARMPIRAIARPLVHTGRPRVCKVGHETGRMAPFLSACAHGAPARVQSRTRGGRFGDYESVCAHAVLWRVQSRTRDRRNGAVLVRLCTRGARACAKSDTRRPIRRTRDRPCRAALVRLCTPPSAPCAKADTTTGEGPGSLRALEGPTAGGHARQAETISPS